MPELMILIKGLQLPFELSDATGVVAELQRLSKPASHRFLGLCVVIAFLFEGMMVACRSVLLGKGFQSYIVKVMLAGHLHRVSSDGLQNLVAARAEVFHIAAAADVYVRVQCLGTRSMPCSLSFEWVPMQPVPSARAEA